MIDQAQEQRKLILCALPRLMPSVIILDKK